MPWAYIYSYLKVLTDTEIPAIATTIMSSKLKLNSVNLSYLIFFYLNERCVVFYLIDPLL